MKWAWRLLLSSAALVAGAMLSMAVPWEPVVIVAGIALLVIWGVPSVLLFVLTAVMFAALTASLFLTEIQWASEHFAGAALVSFVAALTTLVFEAKRTTSDSSVKRKHGLKDLFHDDG